jgi:hypothetical protein
MRGHVRIRSERTPYRRAGLSFGESREIEMPIVDLTGDQLLLLAQDPALRVEVWDEGRYRSIGDLASNASADDLQRVIDHVGAQQGSDDEQRPSRTSEDLQLDELTLQLAAVRTELSSALARIDVLTVELEEANREGDALAEKLSFVPGIVMGLGLDGFEPIEGEDPIATLERFMIAAGQALVADVESESGGPAAGAGEQSPATSSAATPEQAPAAQKAPAADKPKASAGAAGKRGKTAK